MKKIRVGIDLGGTKIEGIVVSADKPTKPLCRLRLPTEADRGYEHILTQIQHLLVLLEKEAGFPLPHTIGMGTPGILDPKTNTLKNSNTQCLNGKPLQADLERILNRPIHLANDANCFALAEATLGAATGFKTVFGIILGTGVGGGLIVDQQILPGRHGIAGEWGQIILDPQGPLSVYGTRGTIEAFLAGPALETFYAELSGTIRPLKEIAERTKTASDPAACATIDRLTTAFAKALSIVINIFDPHAIVIGGGVGNIDALYTNETRQKIAQHVFDRTFETPLLKPSLGDSAGVFGAAALLGALASRRPS